jgi:hypothetical protein
VIADIFDIRVSIAELALRGTLVYWLLFLEGDGQISVIRRDGERRPSPERSQP